MPGDIDKSLECKACGKTFTIRQLLDCVTDYWAQVDVVITETPCCQAREEIRVETGRIVRGYVYAAGAPRFCPEQAYNVPITVRTRQGELLVDLDGEEELKIQSEM